jgi:hypothetical protein
MKHLILAAPFVLVAGVALAQDRPPTAEERTRIEAALRADGYTSWGSIELDDNRVWEVDDAIDVENREWDLELDMETLTVTKQDD